MIDMESHDSCDKLVSLESGLAHPLQSSIKKPHKSHGRTKRILVYVATVLLVVVFYEVWQAVRSDYLLHKLEDGQQTLQPAAENARLRDMAEELNRVQIELKEINERMDRRAQTTPKMIELPETTTVVDSSAGETTEDWEREWIISVLDKSSNDDVKDSNSNAKTPSIKEAMIADEEGPTQIDKAEPSWGWQLHFNIFQTTEDEKDSSKEPEVIETEVGEPTQGETVISDEKPKGLMQRFTSMLQMGWQWGWGNSGEEVQSNSENEEQEKSDIAKIDTTTTPEAIIVYYHWSDTYDDDSNSYDDSYDVMDSNYYDSLAELGDYGLKETTESSVASASVEDEPEVFEPEITESTASQIEILPQPITFRNPDQLREETFPDSEQIMDPPSIVELERWEEFLDAYLRGETPSTTTSDVEGWSYISKRSIDSASNEGPIEFLSPEEMSRKLAVIQQAVDDENHILQNEVDVASEPMKSTLRRKIDDFYRKMDAVSAHIDRLHERYLKMNKLDDDYVSREFPSDEKDLTPDRVDRR